MCGIAGFLSTHLRDPSFYVDNFLEVFRSGLSERGPDNTGFYVDDTGLLVHTRLAIQDIKSPVANQPIQGRAGILIYNGEIYNHYELRSSFLPCKKFQTTSDTETLLYLIEELGIDKTLQQLGSAIFAFAYYDISASKLYLARDHLGIKPLFYTNTFSSGDSIIFSSYSGILARALPDAPLLDREGLASFFHLGAPYNNRTLFTDIYSLPSSSYLSFEISTAKCTISSYTPCSADLPLQLVLKQETLSDCPTGALVSGGVDSSVLALETSPDYCLNLESSESGLAQLVADYCHSKYVSIPQPRLDVEALYAAYALTGHCSASSVIPLSVAQQLKRLHLKVVFSANGADELFYGYPRTPEVNPAFTGYSSLSEPPPSTSFKSQQLHIFRDFETLKPRILGEPITLSPPPIRTDIKNAFGDSWAARAYELNTYVEFDLNITLDHCFMQNSIEARVPFLNYNMISLAQRLSWSDCNSIDLGRKLPLKMLLIRSGISNAIWQRPKQGFSLDTLSIEYMKSNLASILRDLHSFFDCTLDLSTRDGIYLMNALYAFHAWKKIWIDTGIVRVK